MRLNKYIAHCGLCSRRKAVEYINDGDIKVNGDVEIIPYRLITNDDVVTYKGEKMTPKKDLIYVLLNKPKNVICSMADEHGRKTVSDILDAYKKHRLHYIGRLDRNTTGLLIMTNDGDLTQKLSHPSSEVKKIYAVTLDQNLALRDLQKLQDGFELEDGFIKPDAVNYDKTKGKDSIGIELHSGRNRIIRRMIEHIGYNVVTLDRVTYAGLTKRDLPRGWHRELSEQEVIRLKHFSGTSK